MTNTPFVPQSAALPYLVGGFGLRILLITSRGRGRWVPPKGNIERGMTAARSAAKEAHEEAGIVGAIGDRAIGSYIYRKFDDRKRRAYAVDVYPMLVDSVAPNWPEAHQRRREWFPCDTAASLVEEPDLQDLIRGFGAMMGDLKHPAESAVDLPAAVQPMFSAPR